MSAGFVNQLRSKRPPVLIAEPGSAGALTIRVEVAELWDTVRVVARPETPVAEVKERVVAAMYPNGELLGDFVLKLRGWEMLDERASLTDAGVVNGSILLLAYRRRRPVR